MAKISCFPAFLVGKKKKSKECMKSGDAKSANHGNDDQRVKPEEFIDLLADKCGRKDGLDISAEKSVSGEAKVTAVEAAYEGGDEQDDASPMKREFSDLDLSRDAVGSNGQVGNYGAETKSEDNDVTPEAMMASGHVSDPGMIGRTAEAWRSPALKRSCSNIETKRSSGKALDSPTKSRSYDDLANLAGHFAKETTPNGVSGSPASVKTSCTADRVMLKKRSSSQVLPSRSRKLWWRLFLWSHRNLHRPWNANVPRMALATDSSNQQGGYTSDTLEASQATADKKNKKVMEEPTNQWVAFSVGSSPLDRVDAWVHSLDSGSFYPDEEDGIDNEDGGAGGSIIYPNSPEIGESSGKNHSQAKRRTVDEAIQANNIIQSLNTFSSVSHISGMGLKVIPTISAFTSLRAVNLSSNFIVHVSPGSLPKGLHSLDLSRNKIASIEGLRELTKLRVLNLSYNRISRIGHGLSNCPAIKELYLAGNKISDVEGLHRLLKLTVLDLSFNKITTTKALGQLVANYNSLLALNLLGNPIQSNIGDDQLRKAVSGLLPRVAYLNKQPIKPQRAREVATDSVAKAALGNNGWSSRRRLSRRLSQYSGSSTKSRAGEGSSHRASRSRSKSRHQSSGLARK